ncbi:MAG: hypothetical protein WD768_14140 [Phycisphaeraceae bacterium]
MEFKTKVKIGIYATLVVLVIIFFIQNKEQVDSKFLFIPLRMPMFAYLLGTFGLGFGLGYVVSTFRKRKKDDAAA